MPCFYIFCNYSPVFSDRDSFLAVLVNINESTNATTKDTAAETQAKRRLALSSGATNWIIDVMQGEASA